MNNTWKSYRKKLLKDPQVIEEVKRLEPEYELACSLIDARIKKGMTQAEIARKAKTNQASISRLETGVAKPSLSFLERIATALGGRVMIKFEV